MIEARQQNTCVIYDAHKLDIFTLTNFAAYKNALSDICDIFFVLHSNDAPQENLPDGTIILNDWRIFDRYPTPKAASKKVVPGNCDLKTVAAAEELEGYKKYISIEFDVLCTGSIRQSILKLVQSTTETDLGGSYIQTEEQAPSWMWWKSISAPPSTDMDHSKLRKSFLPLSVYSNSFIKAYREALTEGWQGHQEVLMPTIALLNNMKLFDLSDRTMGFTKYPQFGINAPQNLDVASLPLFIHPIKDVHQYNNLPEPIKQLQLPDIAARS